MWKRFSRKLFRIKAPRTSRSMLPVLIHVFAGFSKVDGEIEEREIDSALGFLRYDFPETVYSELRSLYREALRQPQDLNEIAMDLSERLSMEDKIMLGVQLYALISRADLQKDHLIAFYLFMTNLGIASEAIDIVYQLNTGDFEPDLNAQPQGQPLETLLIGAAKPADVVLPSLSEEHSLMGFRFQDLILLKNVGGQPVIIRGRQVREGEFVRLYDSQQVLLGETVLDYQDIVFYFNAKKNVSTTRLYISFSGSGEPYVERDRTNRSCLEVTFGLGITVVVLRDTPGELNDQRLIEGRTIKASLRDKIIFDNRLQILISDLRRRARTMGSRFDLNPTRSEYLVSNNPQLLREGDLLLSAETSGELLFRITFDYAQKTGELEILKSDRPIFIENYPVRQRAALKDEDTITIGDGQFLRCHFADGIIEEERNVISRVQVQDLSLSYSGRNTALDAISFTVQRGEMICVMGPSGCGKSSLMRVLAGHLKPDKGRVRLNGVDLYHNPRNHRRLTPYISYIPHEEAIDPLLTVEENLDFSASIRSPHFSSQERKRRADAKLIELGLSEVRLRPAGDDVTKNLSGGQRKRLNAGLDMIGISDIYLFDEPTSGLSSKDSEHVLEIIRGLAHNKVILISIHQPSARLFHMFHKAILLDNGGKLAFFGTPQQMLEYFHKLQMEESMCEPGAAVPNQPDFIFDILETPLRDLTGDVIYEEDARGHLLPSRRFSPAFWRDRFQTYRLMEEVQLEQPETDPNPVKPPPVPVRKMRDNFVHFSTLLKRTFLSRLRNRGNLTTTLLVTPLLAVLWSVVSRYSAEGAYNYQTASHIPIYLFVTLVIGMFLGLANSADEVLRDRTLLERERNHRLRPHHYVLAKVICLGIFALVQCAIYTAIGDAVLQIRGMFWIDFFWMFSITFLGVIVGLLISSIVPNAKTALNVIPLVLIPQIILGGALIKYEEMNRDLDGLHRFMPWKALEAKDQPSSRLKVPDVCQTMPLRWAYEGLIVAHATQNPISAVESELEEAIRALAAKPELTPEEQALMNQAKNARLLPSRLEAETPAKVARLLHRLKHSVLDGKFESRAFRPAPEAKNLVSAESIFQNEKLQSLFFMAEVERLDHRYKHYPNVFFGAEKQLRLEIGGQRLGSEEPFALQASAKTILIDAVVLYMFCMLGIALLYMSVRRRMTYL